MVHYGTVVHLSLSLSLEPFSQGNFLFAAQKKLNTTKHSKPKIPLPVKEPKKHLQMTSLRQQLYLAVEDEIGGILDRAGIDPGVFESDLEDAWNEQSDLHHSVLINGENTQNAEVIGCLLNRLINHAVGFANTEDTSVQNIHRSQRARWSSSQFCDGLAALPQAVRTIDDFLAEWQRTRRQPATSSLWERIDQENIARATNNHYSASFWG